MKYVKLFNSLEEALAKRVDVPTILLLKEVSEVYYIPSDASVNGASVVDPSTNTVQLYADTIIENAIQKGFVTIGKKNGTLVYTYNGVDYTSITELQKVILKDWLLKDALYGIYGTSNESIYESKEACAKDIAQFNFNCDASGNFKVDYNYSDISEFIKWNNDILEAYIYPAVLGESGKYEHIDISTAMEKIWEPYKQDASAYVLDNFIYILEGSTPAETVIFNGAVNKHVITEQLDATYKVHDTTYYNITDASNARIDYYKVTDNGYYTNDVSSYSESDSITLDLSKYELKVWLVTDSEGSESGCFTTKQEAIEDGYTQEEVVGYVLQVGDEFDDSTDFCEPKDSEGVEDNLKSAVIYNIVSDDNWTSPDGWHYVNGTYWSMYIDNSDTEVFTSESSFIAAHNSEITAVETITDGGEGKYYYEVGSTKFYIEDTVGNASDEEIHNIVTALAENGDIDAYDSYYYDGSYNYIAPQSTMPSNKEYIKNADLKAAYRIYDSDDYILDVYKAAETYVDIFIYKGDPDGNGLYEYYETEEDAINAIIAEKYLKKS